MLENVFNNITKQDVMNFIGKKQNKTNPQTSINKQMTVTNAIASRGGQAPQATAPQPPTSDGFGRTM